MKGLAQTQSFTRLLSVLPSSKLKASFMGVELSMAAFPSGKYSVELMVQLALSWA